LLEDIVLALRRLSDSSRPITSGIPGFTSCRWARIPPPGWTRSDHPRRCIPTFSASFAGAQKIYMEVRNASVDSGWPQPGVWTAPGKSHGRVLLRRWTTRFSSANFSWFV